MVASKNAGTEMISTKTKKRTRYFMVLLVLINKVPMYARYS